MKATSSRSLWQPSINKAYLSVNKVTRGIIGATVKIEIARNGDAH